MSAKTMHIMFSSGIYSLKEQNSSFDSGILRVAYTGKNRNNSFISKETYESCIDSIYNCPIVCVYDRETDTIGEHDMEIIPTSDGGMKIVNKTQPVGIIPESANYWWEEVEDDSGVHEYLCVDALLWKRQEAYQKIKDDGITAESMEISVKDGEMKDGVYVIHRFEFMAFCLLGTSKPCFESASLEVFSCDDFKHQLAEMMCEFKEIYFTARPPQGADVCPDNHPEGGEKTMENEKKTPDSVNHKLPDSAAQSFTLESGFADELKHVLESERIETRWGIDSHYWFFDYDRELNEVYAYDALDQNIYGFPYSMDGDHVVIDFASKKRMKLAVVEFDEGDHENPAEKVFSRIADQYAENDAQWAKKYESASGTISDMEAELDTLRKFKEDAENTAAMLEREQVLARFDDLAGIEAFEALCEKSAEYDVSTLEEKCYAIRGRNGSFSKFSLDSGKAPKLPVGRLGTTSEPYGGVFSEYGIAAPGSN